MTPTVPALKPEAVDFCEQCLRADPTERPSARELQRHVFLLSQWNSRRMTIASPEAPRADSAAADAADAGTPRRDSAAEEEEEVGETQVAAALQMTMSGAVVDTVADDTPSDDSAQHNDDDEQ
eukprot:gene23033-7697_t